VRRNWVSAAVVLSTKFRASRLGILGTVIGWFHRVSSCGLALHSQSAETRYARTSGERQPGDDM